MEFEEQDDFFGDVGSFLLFFFYWPQQKIPPTSNPSKKSLEKVEDLNNAICQSSSIGLPSSRSGSYMTSYLRKIICILYEWKVQKVLCESRPAPVGWTAPQARSEILLCLWRESTLSIIAVGTIYQRRWESHK